MKRYHLDLARLLRLDPLTLILIACLLLALLGVAVAHGATGPAEDAYFSMPFPDYATAAPDARVHTHVCIQGEVASTREEKDGDIHVKLCQGTPEAFSSPVTACVVLEVVPQILLPRPRKGQRIEACGITRWDSWPGHLWRELNPLTSWKAVQP